MMQARIALAGILTFASLRAVVGQGVPAANEALWEASRAGDTTRIAAALAQGADVNAKARYDVTPLIFAAGGGRLEAVRLLVSRGADINAQDTFYRARAVDMALTNGYADVAMLLLQNGADADSALAMAVQANQEAVLRVALAGKRTRQGLQAALGLAGTLKREALATLVKTALDALPPEPAAPAFAVDPSVLPRYAGAYRDQASGLTMVVTVQEGSLRAQVPGQPQVRLVAAAEDTFRIVEANATLTFNGRGGLTESVNLVQGATTLTLARTAEPGALPPASAAPVAPSPPSAPSAAPVAARRTAARHWSSFRGDGGSGNGDGQGAPTSWNVATGQNIKWKTSIPGIATSSPIVWGNRVFVTTAVSSAGDHSIKTGLYGDVKPVDDLSVHEWKVYGLDKASGRILWERTAFKGAPKTKRHTKSSQASSSPVTDGRRVVAVFGAVGLLVAWDVAGQELWRVDLGVLDSGWFFDPAFQWGHSSSPIIYRDTVILQADVQTGSYLAAWDLATGKPKWKTERPDEISTWGTPAIVRTSDGRDELVTNGTKVRGYDPASGALRWTLGPNSEITIGSPVAGNGLVYVTGGYPPVRPIYAIRPGASGDISLPKGQESSAAVAWSNMTQGTYIPTPLVYGDRLFTLNVNGVLTAYDATTGAQAFRGRVGTGGAFSASPIAADGKLYVASEDGEIYVVSAAEGFKELAKNEMGEVIMSTPAISDGLVVVRTMGHLYGIGQ